MESVAGHGLGPPVVAPTRVEARQGGFPTAYIEYVHLMGKGFALLS